MAIDSPSFRAPNLPKVQPTSDGYDSPAQMALKNKIKNASNMYEEHFLREMVKAMRGTTSAKGVIPTSQAEKIFKEQLDDKYVESWSKQGGVGMSDMIYKQIMETYGVQFGIRAPEPRMRGQIPLDHSANYQGMERSKPNPAGNTAGAESNGSAKVDRSKLNLELMRKNASGVAELTLPWGGKVLDSGRLEGGTNFLSVEHENGLKSMLNFQGTMASKLQKGSELKSGDVFGHLSPDAQKYFWSIDGMNARKSEEAGSSSVPDGQVK